MTPPEHTPPPRYTDRAFPVYRYVPGRSPHPTRDTDGHSYNKKEAKLESFDADEWQSCEEYLYGIDLFNHGYWWEAHEALEACWVAAGRHTETGQFVQGLIQVAVAHLKQYQGFTDVAQRMAVEGIDKMKFTNDAYLGIDVSVFRAAVNVYFLEDSQLPVTIALTVGK